MAPKRLLTTAAGLSRLIQTQQRSDRKLALGHLSHVTCAPVWATSLRRMQCTMTMTKPSKESKTAKRIWKRAERRSVMARTADIQVRARRGNTTQELHKDALQVEKELCFVSVQRNTGATFLTFILKV